MFGIPEWAIGTGFITMMFFAGVGILYRFLPADVRRSRRRGVIGVSVGQSHEALEDIQERLGNVEHLEARLAEVEERLDFAERLLARRPEEQRLPGPPR